MTHFTTKIRLHERVRWQEALDFAWSKACPLFSAKGVKRPEVKLEWNGRFTSRMGDARVTRWHRSYHPWAPAGRVRLSKPLWPHMTEEARWDTMLHELAHVYANLYTGMREGHGAVWQRFMRLFERPPARLYDPEKCFVDYQAWLSVKGFHEAPCPAQCGQEVRTTKGIASKMKGGQTGVHACGASLSPDWARANLKPIPLPAPTH